VFSIPFCTCSILHYTVSGFHGFLHVWAMIVPVFLQLWFLKILIEQKNHNFSCPFSVYCHRGVIVVFTLHRSLVSFGHYQFWQLAFTDGVFVPSHEVDSLVAVHKLCVNGTCWLFPRSFILWLLLLLFDTVTGSWLKLLICWVLELAVKTLIRCSLGMNEVLGFIHLPDLHNCYVVGKPPNSGIAFKNLP